MRATSPTIALVAALAASACTSTYTGPVEVTRFVAEDRSGLGSGSIALVFPDEIENKTAQAALEKAVADELRALGYTIETQPGVAGQSASISSSRNAIESAVGNRGPVSVGVGGRTGSYGSGVGVGLGINLGGGQSGPRIITDLAVRISGPDGSSLWEGRAEIPTSINSPYSDVETSARTLAAALFRDFPGGNGETVIIDVEDLQGPE